MSDLLLQTIIDKLAALEIAQLKREDDGMKNAAQHVITNQLKSYQSELNQFADDLKKLNTSIHILLTKPNPISTHADGRGDHTIHHHHLHKGLWISIGLFLLLTILVLTLIDTKNDLKLYEANDTKYRQLKVTADTSLLKLLYKTDSLYFIDAEAFKKYTIQEEERIAERARLFQLAGEKEREAKELRERARSNK